MKFKIIAFAAVFLSVFILVSYWSSKSTIETYSNMKVSVIPTEKKSVFKGIKKNRKTPQKSPKEIQNAIEDLGEKPKAADISPKERQIARKQHLKDYCSKHSFKKNPQKEDVHMLAVDDELKLIYCVIPKVGTSTWKKVIAKPRGVRPGINRWIMWKRLSNYTKEERAKRLKTYFKFVFVREPLQRLLSAYKNKFIKYSSYTKEIRKEIVQNLRAKDYEPEGKNFVSFSEFIQYFSNDIPRNQHWRQYEKLCHPCVFNYDFIGHLETLEEDAGLLLKMAGIDDRASFPPIHESTGSDEVLEYYSQVPTEYITRLAKLYRSDFEMFDYEYLGPVKKLFNVSTNI